MTSITLMYVYHDKNGDIKAITPILEENMSNFFNVATFPIQDVELFLTGKRNTFDYYIKSNIRINKTIYTINKKLKDISLTRTLDNYLTKIDTDNSSSIITIVNDIQKKLVSIEISSDFKDLYYSGDDEQKEYISEFLNIGQTSIYITEKNNPYNLRFTISFSPKNLFDNNIIYFPYKDNYENSSAYTKKVVSKYKYKEKG